MSYQIIYEEEVIREDLPGLDESTRPIFRTSQKGFASVRLVVEPLGGSTNLLFPAKAGESRTNGNSFQGVRKMRLVSGLSKK